MSNNQSAEHSVQKTGNCQTQQQIDNFLGKRESDENANALISNSSKPELSKGSVTESSEIKDASLSSNRCQENLSSSHENKRNRKGRIISSRYMQTAKQINKPTAQVICKVSNSGSARKMIANDKKVVEKVNLNSTPAILSDDGLPLLENNKNTQVTSTPAIHAQPFSHDMSSIMADASLSNFGMKALLAPTVEANNKIKLNSGMQETVPKLALSSDASSAKAPFFSPIEVMYCRYLQAVFLEAKSAEALKKKSQNAKEQLLHLWEKNQELLEIEASLDLEIAAFENLQHVNNHLDSQEKCMEPLNEVTEKLDCEYKNIAKALDTTRHQLPTSDIFLCNMNDLSDALKETEKLSELLMTIVKPHQEPLINLASNLSKIEETVQIQKKELHRCLDLTKNAESLTAQESSLRIQSIQKNIELKQQAVLTTENSIL